MDAKNIYFYYFAHKPLMQKKKIDGYIQPIGSNYSFFFARNRAIIYISSEIFFLKKDKEY
jgi:hypothetical protein